MRIDVRDVGSGGDAVVWSWDGGGHVRVASRGEDARTLEGSFDESGQFRLLERAGSLGEQPATVVSEQVETNVFGATVERVHHLFG
ncbi:MAG: hypothetical protein OEV60_12795, partial [Actinomycetota bacterium]|nr:hypothetical protein [Actinomycetota bacterium]